MNKKSGIIILAIIIAIQIIVPIGMIGYDSVEQKQIDERGEEIKLLVDEVYYSEGQVRFYSDEIFSAVRYYENPGYVVFEKGNNGYDFCSVVEEKPETDVYLKQGHFDTYYQLGYKIEVGEDIGYVDLYEKNNISNGYCNDPEAQAYVVLKVYKNHCIVKGVYIDEMPVEAILEKCENNEIDY